MSTDKLSSDITERYPLDAFKSRSYMQVSRLVNFLSGGGVFTYGSHHLLRRTTTTRCSDREVKAAHAHSLLETDEIVEKMYSASERVSANKVRGESATLCILFSRPFIYFGYNFKKQS